MLTVLLSQLVAGFGPAVTEPQTFSSTSPMSPPTLSVLMHADLSPVDLIINRYPTSTFLVVPGSRVT